MSARYGGDGWELHVGDCLEVVPTLGEVDAVVTSPPYPDQRTYASGDAEPPHPRERPTNESRRARRDAVAEWLDWFPPHLEAVAAALAPRGSAMVNLGTVIRDGVESDYIDEALRRARAAGWCLLHRIVWHKPNPVPYSEPRFMSPAAEYVLWLARSPDAYRGYDDREPRYDPGARVPHSPASVTRIEGMYRFERLDERYEKRGRAHNLHPDGARPGTVITAPVGQLRGTRHSAPMAQLVADRLVRFCCPPGGRVLDPFAGTGTTGRAALRAGRTFVGVELRPLYAEDCAMRLGRWHTDPAYVPPPVDGDGVPHPSLFDTEVTS